MTEQRYKAVQAVIATGQTVGQVAGEWSVSRQTVHRWLRCTNQGCQPRQALAIGERWPRDLLILDPALAELIDCRLSLLIYDASRYHASRPEPQRGSAR